MIEPGLKGKVALITGANSGIGAVIAKALATQGAITAIHYLGADEGDHNPYEHTVLGKTGADKVVHAIPRERFFRRPEAHSPQSRIPKENSKNSSPGHQNRGSQKEGLFREEEIK